jgi:hypothetical protein
MSATLEMAAGTWPLERKVKSVSRMRAGQRNAAQQKLEEVRATQTAFWDALRELEELTGLELCSDVDYEDYELSTLDGATEQAQHANRQQP